MAANEYGPWALTQEDDGAPDCIVTAEFWVLPSSSRLMMARVCERLVLRT
jgi:hypothetical protein